MRRFLEMRLVLGIAGIVAALMGIWIWFAPNVLDYVVAIVLFFGGLYLAGKAFGILRI